MLIVFRLGTFIPVPSVNADVLASQDKLSVFGFLNTFGGGALQKFSIFAMGIMPYITASIIIQLLQMDVVPKFTEWSKQGESGRRKLPSLLVISQLSLVLFKLLVCHMDLITLLAAN